MASASDLISKLPDVLLCFILSYLPIKEAVRSSILSQRWRHLYNQLPKLTLSPDLLIPSPLVVAKVEDIIFNILLSYSSDLKTFDLYTKNDQHFISQEICKWVHCVASKNVEKIYLRHFPPSGPLRPREILPASIFLCNRLSSLTLFNYTVSKIPTGFGGFNHLTDCYFRNVEFRDDSLALFLSHCPLLERLDLELCRVVPQNMITLSAPQSLSISNLNIPVEILAVKCPKLTHLCIYGTIRLSLIKDPIPTRFESPLLNLRKVYACLRNYDEKEIAVLGWLLENSPALEIMDVTVPPPREARKDERYIQLLRRMLDSNFKRPSAPARVLEIIPPVNLMYPPTAVQGVNTFRWTSK